MHEINSKPVTNLLFSLIYYVEQIVYGHFRWLKTMSHSCVPAARDNQISARDRAHFVRDERKFIT